MILKGETISDDRPVSDAEGNLVLWLLRNASVAGDLSHLEASVTGLRVVGHCGCGCPSVDFQVGGQAAGAKPIADALGKTLEGTDVGIILWGRDDEVFGLELYELGEAVRSLPTIESLRPWRSA